MVSMHAKGITYLATNTLPRAVLLSPLGKNFLPLNIATEKLSGEEIRNGNLIDTNVNDKSPKFTCYQLL